MTRCNKIDHLHGLLPGVIETLRAHGCKIEDLEEDEGTLRVPLRSYVFSWPEDEDDEFGLLRTPSGAYVLWCRHNTEHMLHFVGPAPWPDDSVLISTIQEHEKKHIKERGVDVWLKELIRLRLMRIMIIAKAEQATANHFPPILPASNMIN